MGMNRTRTLAKTARVFVIPAVLWYFIPSSLPYASPIGTPSDRSRRSIVDDRGGRLPITALDRLTLRQLTLEAVSGDATRGLLGQQRGRKGDGGFGDLTGIWQCNDGGTYFLRQVGGDLWWYGRDGGGGDNWTNVFHGQIQGFEVIGYWADIPVGRFARSDGKLQLRIDNPGRLLLSNQSGNFGGSEWKR
jgi:hypothetical protein